MSPPRTCSRVVSLLLPAAVCGIFAGCNREAEELVNPDAASPDAMSDLSSPPNGDACRAVKVAAGFNSSCVLTGDNRVLCWGGNERFQFGPAHAQLKQAFAPVEVDVGGKATDINTESGGSMCALIEDTWSCWGRVAPYDEFGGIAIEAPTPIPFTKGARALEAGAVICVLQQDGQIACLTTGLMPRVVDALGSDNIDLSVVFAGLVCGLKSTGTIICRNFRGFAGTHGDMGPIISVDGGGPFMLARDGRISTIGATDRLLAVAPPGYVNIQGSGDREFPAFCVTGPGKPPLCTSNAIWTTGRPGGQPVVVNAGTDGGVPDAGNDAGRDAAAPRTLLALEPFPLADPVADFAIGYNHVCAITNEGQVHCWGDNRSGQLGVDTGGKSVPTPVHVPLCPP